MMFSIAYLPTATTVICAGCSQYFCADFGFDRDAFSSDLVVSQDKSRTLLTPKIDLTAIAKLLRFQVSSLCVSLSYCVKFLAIPKVSVLALCWPQAGDIAVADTKPTPDRSVLFIIGRKSDRSRQRQKNLK